MCQGAHFTAGGKLGCFSGPVHAPMVRLPHSDWVAEPRPENEVRTALGSRCDSVMSTELGLATRVVPSTQKVAAPWQMCSREAN